jgi:hypothetical protein
LRRFGIDQQNHEDIELEVSAQIKRMHRREAYHEFMNRFNNANGNLAMRIDLIKLSMVPRELEFGNED